jgi:hypothetical protein
MSTKEIISEMLSLPGEQRAIVAESLLQSLNNSDEKMDALRTKEAKKRLQEIKSGKSKTVNGDEVFLHTFRKFKL